MDFLANPIFSLFPTLRFQLIPMHTPLILNNIGFFSKRLGLTDIAFPKGKVNLHYTLIGKSILDERTLVPCGISVPEAYLNNVRV